MNVGSEDIPEINTEEIIFALETLKGNKIPGQAEMMKEAQDATVTAQTVQQMLRTYQKHGTTP